MISQNQIARYVEAQEYSLLVDRILTNGRCRSLSARRVLRDQEAAAASGIGLALQRLAELTYRPTPMADGLVRRLLELQQPDGSFAGGSSRTAALAATSTALRGLLTWNDQRCTASVPLESGIELALERGLAFLQRAFCEGDGRMNEALGWAIVLWQLGDAEAFRQRVDPEALLRLVNDSEQHLVEVELCRYAAAMAA